MRRAIVDGYNILNTPPYAGLLARDVDVARARLVEDVAVWSAGSRRAVVVFDGGGNPSSEGRPHHIAGVTVIFSAAGTDADSVIEALAHRYREVGDEVLVATSDAATQWAVMGAGTVRMSASSLAAELTETRAEIAEEAVNGSSRSRIEDRIDTRTRDILARWARGR